MKKSKKNRKLSALIKRNKDRSVSRPLKRARELVSKRGTGEDENRTPVRITNDTVAKHREEVLSGARRFIYPLQHSKHRIAIISGVIISAIILILLGLSWFMLYRQQSTSDFAYRITQIIPFPVARIDGSFVSYEDYLFELKQNMHYLANQENVDFESEEGKLQLAGLRQQAMDRVLDRAVLAKMAEEFDVSVSNQEVEEQIDLIRSQTGVAEGAQTLEDTLREFYGWRLGDLKRVVRSQILAQKLVPLLDTEVRQQADAVLQDLLDGGDFAKAAEEHSDDELTSDNGGVIGYVFRSNTDIPPQLVERAFSLAADEISDELVQTLFGLHIVKTLDYRNSDEARLAHILFRYEDIEKFIDVRQADMQSSLYIDIEPEAGNETDNTLEVEI